MLKESEHYFFFQIKKLKKNDFVLYQGNLGEKNNIFITGMYNVSCYLESCWLITSISKFIRNACKRLKLS